MILLRRLFLLVACVLLLPSTSHAQDDNDILQDFERLFPTDFRSQLIEEWNGDWDAQVRTIQTLDGDDNVAESVMQIREDGSWNNVSRTLNTYDDAGRLTVAESQTWDDDDGWQNASRTTNTYANGNLTEVLTESWDGSNWQNTSRTLNTYDDDGNLTKTVEQAWSGVWLNQQRMVDTYESGRLVESKDQTWNFLANDWENEFRTTYTYSGNQLDVTVDQTWGGSDWENETQTLYEDYTADGVPETVTEQVWTSGDWENDTRDLNTYSGLRLLETTTETWNGDDWDNESQTTLSYDGDLFVESVEARWAGSDWENETRFAATYDGMDRTTELLTQTWISGDWDNEGRIRYSYGNDILPVELTDFTATRNDDTAQLVWATASETNNAGFEVERRVADRAYEQIGFVEGRGTTNDTQHYRFTDDQVPFEADRVTYRLRQVDFDGTHAYSPEVELDLGAPAQLALHGNYPNPFRGATTIRYELPQAGPAQLAVYNVLGQRVAQLLQGEQPAGRDEVVLQADLPSGVYFLRLDAGGQTETRQMTVVR